VADIDPDTGRPEGGAAPARLPAPTPEAIAPLDQATTVPLPSPPRRPALSVSAVHSPESGPFLDRPGIPPTTKAAAWRWVLYALGGFLVGQILGELFGIVAGGIEGKTAAQMSAITSSAIPPEWYVVSTLLGLWVGFFGAPWLASRTHGTRHFCSDLGVRFRWVDLWGLAIGVGAQYVVALLYAPFQHHIHNFDAPSQKLTGGAHGGGIVVVVVAVVILAPAMEELFFRGLLFKALARLFTPLGPGLTSARGIGVVLAVIVDGLLFGLAHGEWVQLPGLALLGAALAAISYKTGRLGMNMAAHSAFNLVAVVTILNQPGGLIPGGLIH
jgi:uncharacterized protein